MSGRVADLILSTRNLAEGSWCYFRELGERVTPKGSYRRKEDAIEAGRKQAQKSIGLRNKSKHFAEFL